MKDRLLYLTIGLLTGIVVMQWTMPAGQASGVQVQSGAIAIESLLVLDEYGETWLINDDHTGTGWFRYSERSEFPPNLPVPASQVKLWSGGVLVTQDNVAWKVNDQSHQWVNCGPWPGGPVETNPQTWGGVKGKYEGENR